jgi:three-Cys-motif partner protein
MDEEIDISILDQIGEWSVKKHDMVAYYAEVFASITHRQFTISYIDGYANRGVSRLRGTNEVVLGSARRVLAIRPQFNRYIFVEQDQTRAADLAQSVVGRSDVDVIVGDANDIVPAVIAKVRYSAKERALCFLDPYNLEGLKWPTISAAGKNPAVDAIVHFPTMAANRTVLFRDRSRATLSSQARMDEYWGDGSWRNVAYSAEGFLPGLGLERKLHWVPLLKAFQERLVAVAGFRFVSEPFPMKRPDGALIYHLLFASHDKAATRIMRPMEKRFGS